MRRPCDRCRQRKSRCVRETETDNCVLCTLHKIECTFLRGPRPRKRPMKELPSQADRTDLSDGVSPSSSTKLSPADQAVSNNTTSLLDGTLGLDLHSHSEYIGPASYHEPALLDLRLFPISPLDQQQRCRPRRVDQSTTFMSYPDKDAASEIN
ncbi:hypothetical protein BO71DRAFT_480899 [Aspergillus ellipticus CBS 707.79]|uniref:Zn(2)-C6 fungal-type domain-containing protein n=1 Tax=Aspergillus ellipticus CBS 707.79 TaxID=1448320 RepID=A0A319DK20_9EURO|nr:hypothetical protein BO71DRAFT_480899 [Aspergillus ellipticus CBS 707.79]